MEADGHAPLLYARVFVIIRTVVPGMLVFMAMDLSAMSSAQVRAREDAHACGCE